ncbi:SRPBCC family protein [Streptomyces sp. BG9H]|uniref:SRPBCC family protein n=1 Tax=Streptomyces anatolicus TaxID=2675858 RepID=A0ABS6YW87_9ACTN|nr:SRPBCC family protein [Streptomyces anatolicus]MBW5425638.1 SRPBCC family protein [Streptomyces anatolicus]
MAVRHQLVKRPPSEVWEVLEDGHRYADWVVGTHDSRPLDTRWPEVGSRLEYTVRLGPWTVSGHTVVRHLDRPNRLELEAYSGVLGTARIAIEVRQWGAHTLVIVDEHPLQGPGGVLHNAAVDALIQIRHRSMLSRLAELVEQGGSPARAQGEPATES